MLNIAHLERSHWPQVHAIYAAGIATGNATFETQPPSWEAWDAAHRFDLRLVALEGSDVAGWAAAGSASVALHLRCGFRVVGRRDRLGQLAGVWRDVLLLERRSPQIT